MSNKTVFEFWDKFCKRYGDAADCLIGFLALLGLLVLGCFLVADAPAITGATSRTLLKGETLLIGIETTLALGLFNGSLLKIYVAVEYPWEWNALNFEREAGGAFLGFVERLVFFASFWQSALLGAAWLAFKLGSKWGVWQHVIKYPEPKHFYEMQKREQVGSRILGRFLNGTLWNFVCGMIGAVVTTALWSILKLAPDSPEIVHKVFDHLTH